MSDAEWESLCDGCARCCLIKLEDEDTLELHFTNVSCYLLDVKACKCGDYTNRKLRVPECLLVRKMKPSEYPWLPETCAYRLLSENKPLPDWHPLVAGNTHAMDAACIKVSGFAVSEDHVHPDQLGDHIINLSKE